MTNQDQSCLRFSLEESIWFPKGQEVNELYSLAIEPDVTITEKNQYVNIQGNLQVVGEYRGYMQEPDHVLHDTSTEHSASRVQNVEFREEEGNYCFTHCFPVDISIQASRVENREAIEVDISSFDYHMPESNCIKLFAELMITGVYDGSREQIQHVEHPETARTPYVDIPSFMPVEEEEPIYESFSANEQLQTFEASAYSPAKEESETAGVRDVYQPFQLADQQIPFLPKFSLPSFETYSPPQEFSNQAQSVGEMQHDQIAESNTEADLPFPEIAYPFAFQREETELKQEKGKIQHQESMVAPGFTAGDGEQEYVQSTSIREQPGIVENKEEESISQEIARHLVLEAADSEGKEFEGKVKSSESFFIDETVTATERNSSDSVNTAIDESLAVTEEKDTDSLGMTESGQRLEMNIQEKAAENESSSHKRPVSLTDFFAKKETISHTKVKVCIVQTGETIQQVAERYSISTHELLYFNKMDDEKDVSNGQVLYIPRTVGNK